MNNIKEEALNLHSQGYNCCQSVCMAYADKLNIDEINDFIKNTKLVFEKALKYKGTYPNIDGVRGEFEKHLMVHMRKNEKCYKCGNIIVKEKVGQRGTYYCPYCQKIIK